MRLMGGRGQRRYWIANKTDGVRGFARAALAPSSLCGRRNPHIPRQTCDLKRGHGGGVHIDRRWVGQMKRKAS